MQRLRREPAPSFAQAQDALRRGTTNSTSSTPTTSTFISDEMVTVSDLLQ